MSQFIYLGKIAFQKHFYANINEKGIITVIIIEMW